MSNDMTGAKFVENVNAHPLPAALFMELLTVAMEAMRGKRREIPPASERIMKPDRLYLSDCPENQMGMSIVAECHRRFADEQEAQNTSQSFLFRWFAINKAREDGRLKEFTKPGDTPRSEMINTAVFAAAAECPLKLGGDFDDSFVVRARALMEDDDE